MAKTKQPPPRKPVKARGSLPSPRVAPQRDTTPWYKKTRFRIALVILLLAAAAFGAKLVIDARARAEERRLDVRAIGQFERRVQDLNLEIQPVYEELAQAPGALLAGELPVEDYRTQAAGWVESFRRLNQGIRNVETPEDIEGLQEVKASYVQATTIYLDAAKMFLAAADMPDPEARTRATVLARNTFLHGAAVYGMGDRAMVRLQNEYDLNDPPSELPPPTTPEEEVPLPPPPAAPDPAAGPGPAGVEPDPATVDPAAPAGTP